ncbi:hypothetical protein KI387_024297, partial [Taxus chinensis]
VAVLKVSFLGVLIMGVWKVDVSRGGVDIGVIFDFDVGVVLLRMGVGVYVEMGVE